MEKIIKKGFTLVELIVVITILAILGTIAFISLQGYSRDARDSTRTTDLGNMKTSLELFSLATGKYPKPDNFSTISYSGGVIWYQGTVGDIVTTNLKSLDNKPLDPLMNTEYVYSVTESFKEYEILGLYEGTVAYNSILNKANAAVTNLIPKVEGTYNGIFVKTKSFIVPTPSIITSELGDITLNGTNIKSQVVTNGINIPKNSLTTSQTGALANLKLSVFTGSITKSSTKTEKINAMRAIQTTYEASSLANNSTYSSVLNTKSSADGINFINTTMLNPEQLPIISYKTISNCGTTAGEVIYGTINGGTGTLTCEDDIIICNGTPGDGYTISACNMGASVTNEAALCIDAASCTTARVGYYYQFGRNLSYEEGMWTNGTSGAQWDWKAPGGSNAGSANDWGVYNSEGYTATYSNRSYNDKIKMKGPCPTGYHIPTRIEFRAVDRLKWWNIQGELMVNELNMPKAGSRNSNGGFYDQGIRGIYRNATPNVWLGFSISFTSTSIDDFSSGRRSNGHSIRCFRN